MVHTEYVRFLSRRLFDELKLLHDYRWEEAQLRDEAAQLHDIGLTVGYHGHHRHGAFLIDNTLLPGMTHPEKALIIGKRRVELTLTADRPTPVEIYEAEKLACCSRRRSGVGSRS